MMRVAAALGTLGAVLIVAGLMVLGSQLIRPPHSAYPTASAVVTRSP